MATSRRRLEVVSVSAVRDALTVYTWLVRQDHAEECSVSADLDCDCGLTKAREAQTRAIELLATVAVTIDGRQGELPLS